MRLVPPRSLRSPGLVLAISTALPGAAMATERQLVLGGELGFATSSGPRGGPGGVAQLSLAYGLNDAFAFYATTAYSLAFPAAPFAPRHAGELSAGVYYAFDVIRVVPYVGLGARVDLVGTLGATDVTPSMEVRGGVAYLFNRSLSLDLQASYAFPFLYRELTGDFITVTLGLRLARDL